MVFYFEDGLEFRVYPLTDILTFFLAGECYSSTNFFLVELSENSRYRYLCFRPEEQGGRLMLHLTDYIATFTGLTTNQIRSPVCLDRRTHLQPVDTFSCVGGTRKFVAVFTGPTHYLALNTTVQSTPSHQTPVYDPLFKYPLASGIATQILLVYS